MKFEDACRKAVEKLKSEGYVEGFTEIVDTGKSWLFKSVLSLEDEVEYGINPISLDKKTGKIIPFRMGNSEDRKSYYEGISVEIPANYRAKAL